MSDQVVYMFIDKWYEIVGILRAIRAIAGHGIEGAVSCHLQEFLLDFFELFGIQEVTSSFELGHDQAYALACLGFLTSLRPLSLDMRFSVKNMRSSRLLTLQYTPRGQHPLILCTG
jgi:hypothetical protein